jgi:hypothetical protein
MIAAGILDAATRLGATRLKKVSIGEWAGPCPVCGGRDRFSVNTKKGVFNCRGCGVGGDAIALTRHVLGCSYPDALAFLGDDGDGWRARERRWCDSDAAKSKPDRARWIWRQRQPIERSIAETYLREARGYHGEIIPSTLGFLPARDNHLPALIAAFGMATEPEPGMLAIADAAVTAVLLIKLTRDGSAKADVEPNKIIVGGGALGSPIIVAPPNDLLGLAIIEGIEDALSIHEATGLGAWASGGATRLPALADSVPDYIDHVTVVADCDPTGITNATALGDRLRKRGVRCAVVDIDGARAL